MSNSSNQKGTLVLIAIIMGAAVFAFMFFGSEIEQKNLSSSYGNVALPASGYSSGNAEAKKAKYTASETHSDFSGVSLPSFKKGTSTTANYSEVADVAFPSNAVAPIDVQIQGSNRKQNVGNTRNDAAYLRSQLVATTIMGSTDVQYISNTQNLAKTDIDASFMLIQARNAEIASTSKQGSKRLVQSVGTASTSTDVNGKKILKKVDGDPNDPGAGASLPIGDGMWLMLMFAGVYAVVSMKYKQLQVKRQDV